MQTQMHRPRHMQFSVVLCLSYTNRPISTLHTLPPHLHLISILAVTNLNITFTHPHHHCLLFMVPYVYAFATMTLYHHNRS